MATIKDLHQDKSNPRKHGDRNLKVIADSLRDYGFARSIVIDENDSILAGNGVVQAAALAGLENVIEVEADGNSIIAVRRRGLTDEQKQRLKYADNRSGELASWDATQLLADLNNGLSFDGLFDKQELDALLAGLVTPESEAQEDPGAQTDRAEELQAKWQVKDGDLYQIGEHFAICGDCREHETWRRLLTAAGIDKVNGVFTSPPYAMQRKDQYGGVPTAEYVDWWEALQANVKENLATDGSFFVNIKAHCEDGQRVLYCMDLVCAMVRRWGWRFVDDLVWVKNGFPGGWNNRFRDKHEPIYHFCTQSDIKFSPLSVGVESDYVFESSSKNTTSAAGSNKEILAGIEKFETGLARPGNVLTLAHNFESLGQGAMFPVSLPDFFIRAYSDPGDVWMDPFLGSGTTIVAAHQNQRRGLGSERLPKYMAVILERLSAATGQTPVLSGE